MSFEYRQSTDGGSNWGAWTAISGSDETTTEVTVTGLTNDIEYTFQVRAVGGVASQNVTVTPKAPAVDALQFESEGPYGSGDSIEVSVYLTGTVAVTGTPQLALDIGGVTRQANYTSHTTSEVEGKILTLVNFSYTVVAADSDSDGVSIASDALSLNGGTITGIGTTAAILTIPADKVITDDSSHTVDGSS